MKNSKIKIIGITGATGVLGRKLITKLKNCNLIIFKGNISIKQNVNNWVNRNNFDAVIHLAAIVSTTKAKKEKNKALIISVIDNLIKGGAGQAVQNLNIKYNFPITRGLV